MTREEAIKILNRDNDDMRKGYFCVNDFLAIEVLKSEEPCDDCISRQAVVEYIKASGADLGHDCENDIVTEDILNMPPETPTQRWIPCNKQLPNIKNRTESYLVTLKNETVCDALFTECEGEHWWNYNYDDVVAWQELSGPYKAEMESEG